MDNENKFTNSETIEDIISEKKTQATYPLLLINNLYTAEALEEIKKIFDIYNMADKELTSGVTQNSIPTEIILNLLVRIEDSATKIGIGRLDIKSYQYLKKHNIRYKVLVAKQTPITIKASDLIDPFDYNDDIAEIDKSELVDGPIGVSDIIEGVDELEIENIPTVDTSIEGTPITEEDLLNWTSNNDIPIEVNKEDEEILNISLKDLIPKSMMDWEGE